MGIRVACSYKATFQLPENPANYNAILVTFAQNGQNLINLDATHLQIDGQNVIAQLDQEQTNLFAPNVPAFVQIRAYKSQYEAPGSRVWPLDVWPSLNQEVLP